MYYVYLLSSQADPNRMYVGHTNDLERRLADHNVHTAKLKPWKLCTYVYFDDKEKAIAFERYLKSGSGRAFAKRHL